MTRAHSLGMPLDGQPPRGARRIFFAVSDPTRRGILDLLLVSECSVSDLVRPFRISQPAISQHLRMLPEKRNEPRPALRVHLQALAAAGVARVDGFRRHCPMADAQ